MLAATAVMTWGAVQAHLCEAQEPVEDEREEVMPPIIPSTSWNALISLGYMPSADLHGAPGSVGISEYRLRLVHNQKLDNKVTLTLGGGYGLRHLKAPADAGLPLNLHALYGEVGTVYNISDRSFVTLKLYPGLSSDFEDIGTADIRMPVLALGGHSFNNGMTLVGGFIYQVGYRVPLLIPALGFIYQPNEQWRVDLIAPRPGVTYSVSRKVRLFIAGDFAVDEYGLHGNPKGASVIRYRDYKAMGGVDYLPQPATKLSLAIGYAFSRYFDFYDRNLPSVRIDDVPFMRLSLDVGW
jgi:hypothetical protein